ncbi:hypothetical protein ACOSQ3_015390 [Xanthoceras sorbifolium]
MNLRRRKRSTMENWTRQRRRPSGGIIRTKIGSISPHSSAATRFHWLVLLMNPLCITSFSRTLKTRDTRGIYTVNCGLDNVTMSWGGQGQQHNSSTTSSTLHYQFPFLLCYAPFRRQGDAQVFNRYDLYSKSKFKINQEEAKPYYLSLIKKYFPEKLKW